MVSADIQHKVHIEPVDDPTKKMRRVTRIVRQLASHAFE
jgi:hypothetical protein